MTDKRIITEQGLEGRIAALLEPVIEQLGYRLVRIRVSAMNGTTLQIMAERPDGSMSVEDCEAVSRGISPVLDVEDPMDRAYHLEISSPGIDRPLVRVGDFEAWSGQLMKLETTRLVANRKRFRGHILSVSEEGFRLERDGVSEGEDRIVDIPFDALSEARLILTDDLIAASLKADKAARKAKGLPIEDDDETPDAAGEPGAH